MGYSALLILVLLLMKNDILLSWFKDYLRNRTQQVSIENELSQISNITSGVPQGSILGPLLFVLLINDLPSRLKICDSLMYADDTVLFHSSRDVHAIEKALSSDLEVVERSRTG